MKTKKIVQELEDYARQIGLEIRKGKGSFRGGYCTVSGQETIVLNKLHVPEVHLTILAECLRNFLEDTSVLKAPVRRALEDAWEAQSAMLAEDADVE